MEKGNKTVVQFYDPPTRDEDKTINEEYWGHIRSPPITANQKFNTYLTQNTNSVFDVKSARTLSVGHRRRRAIGKQPQCHLTTERK